MINYRKVWQFLMELVDNICYGRGWGNYTPNQQENISPMLSQCYYYKGEMGEITHYVIY